MTRKSQPGTHDHDHGSLLRAAGLRITPIRLSVIGMLCSTHEVLSADQIVAALKAKKSGKGRAAQPDRVTVYRTLNSLVDAGIAHRMDPGDRVFRFGLSGEHATHAPKRSCDCGESENCGHPANGLPATESGHAHPHFVCDSCGKVECLDDTEVVLKPPQKGKNRASRTVRQQEVVLRGSCGDCDKP